MGYRSARLEPIDSSVGGSVLEQVENMGVAEPQRAKVWQKQIGLRDRSKTELLTSGWRTRVSDVNGIATAYTIHTWLSFPFPLPFAA